MAALRRAVSRRAVSRRDWPGMSQRGAGAAGLRLGVHIQEACFSAGTTNCTNMISQLHDEQSKPPPPVMVSRLCRYLARFSDQITCPHNGSESFASWSAAEGLVRVAGRVSRDGMGKHMKSNTRTVGRHQRVLQRPRHTAAV